MDSTSDRHSERNSQEQEMEGRRVRTLTEKGAESYQGTLDGFRRRIRIIEQRTNFECNVFRDGNLDREDVDKSLRIISDSLRDYTNLTEELLSWLARCNTADSLHELDIQRDLINVFKTEIEASIREMQRHLKEPSEPAELRQGSTRQNRHSAERQSKHSGRSVASSTLLLEKRAKAEAAKTSLQFADKEAELKLIHAQLQYKQSQNKIELEMLDTKRNAEMANAEYEAVQDSDPGENRSELNSEIIDARTEQYVNEQRQFTTNNYDHISNQEEHVDENRNIKKDNDNVQLTELSHFLLKKDMLLSRFVRFNDKPEMFHTWKTSFASIVSELKVTPFEEADLLVKWLGPKSSEFAQTIRVSNVSNPKRGVEKIWERSDECYGSPELIDSSVRQKLERFPKLTNKDRERFYDLHDILAEILSLKSEVKLQPLLSYFDTSAGINPVVSKLPPGIQSKWRDKASAYKQRNGLVYPPFSFFVEFIRNIARTYNDPGFQFDAGADYHPQRDTPTYRAKVKVSAKKTAIDGSYLKCVIHTSNHPLNECRSFREKPFAERLKLLKYNSVCFRCCNSKDHMKRECKSDIKCTECGSRYHTSALHIAKNNQVNVESRQSHGGEPSNLSLPKGRPEPNSEVEIRTACTEVCKGQFTGKSCAKILPVYVAHKDDPAHRLKTYAILDEQSNKTLVRGGLLDYFGVKCQPEEYTLMSCSGKTVMSGRRANNFVVESLDGVSSMQLPTMIECDEIPSDRNEIPTPDVVRHHPHLRDLADKIGPVDNRAEICLLIGRDLMEAHHVLDQTTGSPKEPYAQRLKLGWVVIGEVCLGERHISTTVNSCRTYILQDSRPSILKPCPNKLKVQERHVPIEHREEDSIGSTVFKLTEDDNKIGMSVEDKVFLTIMEDELYKDEKGNWCAPLPFKQRRERLPNNRQMALKRARSGTKSLQSDETKRQHFTAFMEELLNNDHAEIAPPLPDGNECWYLPVFGIYHPKKPGKIRCVFDSSAKFRHLSLNSVLLSGPDLNNSLLAVLMRFRKNKVAVSADIKQMFYSFTVREYHRDYLRFLWHKDNDINNELIDYRMKVHVFGNSQSPSVAIYGLHKTVECAEEEFGTDVREFVERNFYVDDGLVSLSTCTEAIELLERTQQALSKHGNLYLHKFVSNDENVMAALPSKDLADSLKSLDFREDCQPLQRDCTGIWCLIGLLTKSPLRRNPSLDGEFCLQ